MTPLKQTLALYSSFQWRNAKAQRLCGNIRDGKGRERHREWQHDSCVFIPIHHKLQPPFLYQECRNHWRLFLECLLSLNELLITSSSNLAITEFWCYIPFSVILFFTVFSFKSHLKYKQNWRIIKAWTNSIKSQDASLVFSRTWWGDCDSPSRCPYRENTDSETSVLG